MFGAHLKTVMVKSSELGRKLAREFSEAFYSGEKKIFVLQGGTGSSKTVSILQIIATIMHSEGLRNEDNKLVTITGQDLPNLKDGPIRDMDNFVLSQDILAQGHLGYSKGTYTHLFYGGGEVQFKSYSDAQDAKSGKRYGLFINEAQGVSWEIADELIRRTSGPIFIDYNPTAEFWVHDYILGRDDVWFNVSTFEDNEHCPDATIAEIMNYYTRWQETGLTYWENKWKIYGLGQIGVSEDRVFNNVERVSGFPSDCKRVGYGMDFGFKNDPTALVKCGIRGDDIYVQQIFYDYGMTDKDIYDALLDAKVFRYIVGDGGGGGDRVIYNLRQRGIGIKEVQKEEIKVGIMKLYQYNLKVVRPSSDLWTEFKKYKYREIKGRMTNIPIDRYNHGIDSIRYWAVKAVTLRTRRKRSAEVYVP